MNRYSCLIRTLLFVPLLALAACDSPAGPADDLPVTRILNGSFSHSPAPGRLVLRSQREFEDAWAAMFVNVTMPPMRVDVDFSREMVVIALAGPKPSSGYCIAVDAAAGNRRTVTVTVRSAGPTAGPVLPVVTHPFDVVRIPRRDEVVFSEVSGSGSCSVAS